MDQPTMRTTRVFWLAIVVEGGLAVLAVGIGWILGRRPWAEIGWSIKGLLWGCAATVPMAGLLVVLVKAPVAPLRRLLRLVDDFLTPLFRGCTLAEMAAIAALAGLGEELLFRGVLQASLADALGPKHGPWIALAAASAAFAVCHWITPTYALLAGAIGLYLGGLWIASGNLLAPILAHALYDFLALVYLTRVRKGTAGSPSWD
jgi:membrane protease YdiL (CAAX protease family)